MTCSFRFTRLNTELAFVKQSFPTLIGFSGWAAGAFDTTYVLTETPFANGTDQALWVAAGKFKSSHR